MKVLLIGGVFGRDESYRRSINPTPEMTLAAGLRNRGIEVVTAGHTWGHSLAGIDVVHVHHLAKSVPGLAIGRPVRRVPLVFTRHNEEKALPVRRAMTLHLINCMADSFVALSHQEADYLRTRVRGRVVVIRNGIDVPARVSRTTRPEDGPWRLLFSGQLIPRKGVDVLLRALAVIRPQLRVDLRVVYHNPSQLPELQALALQLGVADDVTFVGPRDAAGMAEEYRLAHALVLPSRAGAESLPSVITEALLAQRPVIASADAGVPEQVVDAGIVVAPDEVTDLAAAILRLTSEYEVFTAATERRSRDMHPEYDVDTMVDRHLELYMTLLNECGDSRATSWRARSSEA